MVDAARKPATPWAAGVAIDSGLLAQPRYVRAPGDGVRLAVGVVVALGGLLLASIARRTLSGVEADLIALFGRLPRRFGDVVVGTAQVAGSLVPVISGVVLLATRRYRLFLLIVIASLVAVGIMATLDATILSRHLEELAKPVLEGTLSSPGFPSSGFIAGATAVATVAGPWASSAWKRAAWWGVGVLVFLRIVAAVVPALDVVVALGVGLAVGAAVLLVHGAPTLRPAPAAIVNALREAGYPPARLEALPTAPGRALAYRVTDEGGRRWFVKVRTPYDRSADLVERIVRWVRVRPVGEQAPRTTLKRTIEHELAAGLEAVRSGVRAPVPQAVAVVPPGPVALVQDLVDGVPIDRLPPERIDDELLQETWRQLGALHAHRIAHRDLRPSSILVDEHDRVWLVDFEDAELAAPADVRDHDIAQLLVALALLAGPEASVRSAVQVLGPEVVARAMPLLQPLALAGPTRRGLSGRREVLDQLREAVQAETGVPEVELEQLARVQPRTLMTLAGVFLALYVLLPQLGSLGATVDAFTKANWLWTPAVVGAAALTFVFAAVALQGSVPLWVPFGPSFEAQVAGAFVGKITPASTGGMALNVRFLQRAGLDTAVATAGVGLDTLAGLVVHLTLLFGFVVWAGRSDLGVIPAPRGPLLIAVGVAAVVSAAVVLGVPRLRRRLLAPVLRFVRRAAGALGAVLTDPLRVLALMGGSAGITLSFIVAMAASVQAFGGGIGFPQLGAIYLAAAAVATVAPTPGGLGALEATLAAGLNAAGLDQGVAVSSVLLFRLVTFWLPILPGWVSFQRLQRREWL